MLYIQGVGFPDGIYKETHIKLGVTVSGLWHAHLHIFWNSKILLYRVRNHSLKHQWYINCVLCKGVCLGQGQVHWRQLRPTLRWASSATFERPWGNFWTQFEALCATNISYRKQDFFCEYPLHWVLLPTKSTTEHCSSVVHPSSTFAILTTETSLQTCSCAT
jgi:hypothetical protein